MASFIFHALLSCTATVAPPSVQTLPKVTLGIVTASSEACAFRCSHNGFFNSGCTLKATQTNSCLYSGARISGDSVDCSDFSAEHGHLRSTVIEDPEE